MRERTAVPGIHLLELRSILMALLITAARRVALAATLAVLLSLLFVSPAAAHAELLNTTPGNGAELSRPPTEVQMTFTEPVNLVRDGIRLVDGAGAVLPTPDPTVEGGTVTWQMPADLSEGAYVVTFRVVSADGHPISGAFSFGVGSAATAVPDSAAFGETAGTTVSDATTAPRPVAISRLAGYVAFALFAGVAAFVLWCAPDTNKNLTLQLLARSGLIGGAIATVAGLLVQGPYTAGVPMSHVVDLKLLAGTLATPFGTAMLCRLALYGVLGLLAWRLSRISTGLASWLVPLGVASTAVTIAAAGHGGSSDPLGLGVHALHALAAGLWVGGLVVLVALRRSVEPRALHRFSTLAMASVLTLILTGILNSMRQLTGLEQLLSDYGLTLVLKILLVAGSLTAAAVSRWWLRQKRIPLGSVRVEAALTVAVLAVTALLSTTAPPPQVVAPATHSAHHGGLVANDTVQMSLGDQGRAALTVSPATTTGSHVHLMLTDSNGRRQSATQVTLKVANPGRDIAPIPVPMSMRDGAWVADYRFPFAGTWKTIFTVEGVGPSAVVTSADISIRD
jgi:copper transport protein